MNRFLLRLYGLLFCLFLGISVAGQDIRIGGIVKDAETGFPLGFCSISVAGSNQGTVADSAGRFNLVLPRSVLALIASLQGYETETIRVSQAKARYEILLRRLPQSMNEVVVTGVSRKTRLRENPVPVATVSSKAIAAATESNIIDVLVKNVPGLNAVKTGPNISKPFIRGLGYNRVLTLFDGMRQEGQQWGDEHGLEVDGYNVERAEVILGPASLMYGSDAVAGVVSLMPVIIQQTDGRLHGNCLSEYQSNNGLIGQGFRLGSAGGHWSWILRGALRIAKNYTNAADGRVYNTGFRETNASAAVRYTTTRGYSDLNFTWYNDLQGIPDGSRDSLTRRFTMQTAEGSLDDIKDRPLVPDNLLNSYVPSPLHQHIQHVRVYSNSHYALGRGDMDLLLGFQQNIRREYNHPTDPKQAGMFVRLNTVNYGFRYNLPSLMNTSVSAGVNGMYQENRNKDATDFPIPDYQLFDAGIYLTGQWEKNKWTISGGLRYDLRFLQGNNFYTQADPLTGFNRQVSGNDTAGAFLQFPAFQKYFSGISMSIGSTWQPNARFLLRFNIARGYRAPNITEFASNGLDPGAHIIYLGNRDFAPEFSLQENLGGAYESRNVSASLNLFNNNMQRYIYLSLLEAPDGSPLVDAQGNKTYQYRQSRAQLYGLEFTATLHPASLPGFSLNQSLSCVYGYNRNPVYKHTGINGEYLPLIPPFRLLGNIGQRVHIGSRLPEGLQLKAEVEYNGAQHRYLRLNNTETPTPDYLLFNFSVGTEIHFNGPHTLQCLLEVNNLLNRIYQSNLSRLKYFEYYDASPNGRKGIYNMGRNICLRINWSF